MAQPTPFLIKEVWGIVDLRCLWTIVVAVEVVAVLVVHTIVVVYTIMVMDGTWMEEEVVVVDAGLVADDTTIVTTTVSNHVVHHVDSIHPIVKTPTSADIRVIHQSVRIPTSVDMRLIHQIVKIPISVDIRPSTVTRRVVPINHNQRQRNQKDRISIQRIQVAKREVTTMRFLLLLVVTISIPSLPQDAVLIKEKVRPCVDFHEDMIVVLQRVFVLLHVLVT
jgi:hypothetical protein